MITHFQKEYANREDNDNYLLIHTKQFACSALQEKEMKNEIQKAEYF